MKDAEGRKLECQALQQFVGLVALDGSAASRVRVAMDEELTQRQRELIELYYLENMNMSEIACRLGISPSTVSRTLKRGRGRRRKYIKYNGQFFTDSLAE